MNAARAQQRRIHLPAPAYALAAWALPGLGHWLLGERERGYIIGSTLLGLFVAGLLVGSVDVVDMKRDTLWFVGEAMIGPTALVAEVSRSQLHQRLEHQVRDYTRTHRGLTDRLAVETMLLRREPMAYYFSLGRVNELGTLYCTLAGVLNLLVILDVAGRSVQPQRPVGVSLEEDDGVPTPRPAA